MPPPTTPPQNCPPPAPTNRQTQHAQLATPKPVQAVSVSQTAATQPLPACPSTHHHPATAHHATADAHTARSENCTDHKRTAVPPAQHTPPPDLQPSHHHCPPADDDTSADADSDFSSAPQESDPTIEAPAGPAAAPAARPTHCQYAQHPPMHPRPNAPAPTINAVTPEHPGHPEPPGHPVIREPPGNLCGETSSSLVLQLPFRAPIPPADSASANMPPDPQTDPPSESQPRSPASAKTQKSDAHPDPLPAKSSPDPDCPSC